MRKLNAIKTSIVIGSFLILGLLTLSAFINNNPDQDIIGIWISEDDPNWKIEFKTNGKCYWYYTGDDTDTYTYTITDLSNSINQTADFCGKIVSAGKVESYYLKLVDTQSNDSLCYQIFGLTDSSLSINLLGASKIFVFDKQ
jgi:hypothetical protein